ncbi:hypothetical protein SRHO_G00129240 [Serrasalmus rhombeus]
MITHAFDVAVVNCWLEYTLDAKRANIQTKDIQDLLHFKMNVAQCLALGFPGDDITAVPYPYCDILIKFMCMFRTVHRLKHMQTSSSRCLGRT